MERGEWVCLHYLNYFPSYYFMQHMLETLIEQTFCHIAMRSTLSFILRGCSRKVMVLESFIVRKFLLLSDTCINWTISPSLDYKPLLCSEQICLRNYLDKVYKSILLAEFGLLFGKGFSCFAHFVPSWHQSRAASREQCYT